MVHRRALWLPLALGLSLFAHLVEGGGNYLFRFMSIIRHALCSRNVPVSVKRFRFTQDI